MSPKIKELEISKETAEKTLRNFVGRSSTVLFANHVWHTCHANPAESGLRICRICQGFAALNAGFGVLFLFSLSLSFVSLVLSVFLSLSFYLSFFLSLSLYRSVGFSVSSSLSVFLCLSPFLSPPLSFCLSFCLSVSLSLFLSLILCVCPSSSCQLSVFNTDDMKRQWVSLCFSPCLQSFSLSHSLFCFSFSTQEMKLSSVWQD